jgi:hypothetical protein
MSRLLATAVLVAAMVAVTLPSASGFALLSPLILRVNPGAVVAGMKNNKTSDKLTSVGIPPPIVNFGHDEDTLRCKHEFLSEVYEKALTRGFE